MARIVRILNRHTGGPGSPGALRSGQPCYNSVEDVLYIGAGNDGSDNATSIVAIAGAGAFLDLVSAQTVGGKKTFSTVPASSQDASAGTDLVRKSQHDAALGDKADTSHSHVIGDTTGLQAALDAKANTTHSHVIGDTTGLQTALDAKAPLASPGFTGTPTAPTAAPGTNTTQVATAAFVQAAVAALIDSSPGALDTLNELAAALGDDPNFATTMTNALALKAPLASPAFTGNPTATTQSPGSNSNRIATTAFVQAELDEIDGGTY